MNKERLIRLAELLEADAANPTGLKFDLGYWAVPAELSDSLSYEERSTLIEKGITLPEISSKVINCNTAACAVGLAVLSEAFKADGLEGEINSGGELVPKFGCYFGFDAVNVFFSIPTEDAERLFTSDAYPVSKGAAAEEAVALRIRRYVNGENIHPNDEGE